MSARKMPKSITRKLPNKKDDVKPPNLDLKSSIQDFPNFPKEKDPHDWIRKIPLLKRGDEDLHKQLSAERKERSFQKHFKICQSELESIFNYAFDTIEYQFNPQYSQSKEKMRYTEKYRNGFYLPDEREVIIESEYECELRPLHSLEIENYLHISSDSIFSDLAVFFGIPYNENSISDASPKMNNCLQILQKNVIPYLTPYKTPHIAFPYNICVTGPQYSGKTTICSILSQALDVTIIQVLGASTEKKKTKAETQEPEVLPEEKYPLPNMIVIQYIDDKQIISEIISSMKEQHRNYGFVFSGFPVTKAQFSALEKAILSLESDSVPKSPRSPRKKAKEAKQPISGIIFSMHTPEKFMERSVDPVTGHVFAKDFNSPSFMELEGTSPIDFGKRLEEVISRLVNYDIPEEYEQNQKTISLFSSLENSLKKSTSTLIIGTKKHFREIIEQIDEFISPFTTIRPCSHLVSPQELLLAAHSYIALQSWQQILFTPGRTIADQSKLVNSLSSKLDELTSNAIDRFSLVISQQDRRSKLVEDFKNKEILPKETYTKIWEESILVRDENLSSVDGAIEFAGMIELVLEMKKAPKIVFMALASKLLYGMWFRTEFKNVIEGKEELLSPLNLLSKEIEPPIAPIFDFQEGKYKLIRRSTTGFGSDTTLPTLHTASAAFPASQTIFVDSNKSKMQRTKVNIEERRALAELKGFDYLTEVMPSLDIKSSQNIKFDLKRFCQCMGIPMLKMTTNFNSTLQYAEEFFTKLRESALSDESLSNECATMLSSFRKFVISAKKKEAFMVNAIFDLRDSLEDICYEKCNTEMERFSEAFNRKEYPSHFDYAFDKVSQRVKTYVRRIAQIERPIYLHKLVPFDYILKISEECGKRKLHHTTAKVLFEIANHIIEDNDIRMLFEICTLVAETSVCIDVSKFLEQFAHNDTEAEKLSSFLF